MSLLIVSLSCCFASATYTDTRLVHYTCDCDPEDMELFYSCLTHDEPLRDLPSSLSLESSFPDPLNQSTLLSGGCASFAAAYAAKSSSEYCKRYWTKNTSNHLFSPLYIHSILTNDSDYLKNVGNAMKAIKNKGACPLTYYPFGSGTSTLPTATQYSSGNLYKASSYNSVNTLNGIKNQLYMGRGVCLSVKVYDDLKYLSWSNQIYDTISGSSDGNHAICLIGYNDNKGNGAFYFINSWGTDWGLDGYGWISYDLVGNSSVNNCGAYGGYYLCYSVSDNYIMGDVDDDGFVTVADARLALRYSTGLETLTSDQFVLADVDGNAQVTSSDAQEIMAYASGTISEFSLYN